MESTTDIFDMIDSYNKFEYRKVIVMLFKYGVTIKQHHILSKQIILTAVELGFVCIVEKLFKLGVCPNTVLNNDLMYSMLHIACLHRENEVVKLSINKEAGVNCRDHQSKTPLFYAVHNSDRRIIKMLLRNHADINVKARDGRTPLSLSIEDVDSGIATLLLMLQIFIVIFIMHWM